MAIWIIFGTSLALLIWFVTEKLRRRTRPVTGGIRNDVSLPYRQRFELYSNGFSHCSRKIRLLLAALNIPYRSIEIDLIETGSYQTLSPEYLRVNPSGLIPTLVFEGHPVYESDDIMAFLVEHAPDGSPSLVPKDPDDLEELAQWIEFLSLSSEDPMRDADLRLGACIPGVTLPLFVQMIQNVPVARILPGLLFHPDKARPVFFLAARLFGDRILAQKKPAEVIEYSRRCARGHLQKVNQHLSKKKKWLVGDHFTLADISFGCALMRLDEARFLDEAITADNLDQIGRYWDAMNSTSCWRAAFGNQRSPSAIREKLPEHEFDEPAVDEESRGKPVSH